MFARCIWVVFALAALSAAVPTPRTPPDFKLIFAVVNATNDGAASSSGSSSLSNSSSRPFGMSSSSSSSTVPESTPSITPSSTSSATPSSSSSSSGSSTPSDLTSSPSLSTPSQSSSSSGSFTPTVTTASTSSPTSSSDSSTASPSVTSGDASQTVTPTPTDTSSQSTSSTEPPSSTGSDVASSQSSSSLSTTSSGSTASDSPSSTSSGTEPSSPPSSSPSASTSPTGNAATPTSSPSFSTDSSSAPSPRINVIHSIDHLAVFKLYELCISGLHIQRFHANDLSVSLYTFRHPTSPALPVDQAAYLDGHNLIRVANGAAPLTWSGDLQAKAESYAQGCQFQHSDGALGPVGENLAAATGLFTAEAAVALFAQDGSKFDPQNPTFTHFTQMVWQSTTQLGCAAALCDSIFPNGFGQATYHVCLYNPVGNIVGEEQFNVQA
ncbi:Cell wall protein PRY3 [Grifola frondosa]|uniref:Cell wall protein PRY3 n=1 Tax=Grifola frondosa TaxID=5627 RepID=A0A1C7MJS4_GRIFR|nr:Cell wall protein PRY3 [Grifola frondosa]